jgi:drug/metabolite transporter (DMT)-like permease
MKTAALISINLAALLFGCAALCGKLNLSPFSIVCARSGFALLALLGVQYARRGHLRQPRGGQWRLFLSSFTLAAHWLLFFASVQLGSITLATVSFACFPLFTIILSAMFQKKMPSIVDVFSGLTIIFCLIVMGADHLYLGRNDVAALACGILSALSFAGFGLLSQELNRKNSAVLVSLYQNLYVFLLLLPAAILTDDLPQEQNTWLTLAFLGFVITAGGHQLYFFSMRRIEASTCAAFLSMEPIYAVLLAQYLLQEEIRPLTIYSGIGIFGASLALLWQEKKLARRQASKL